MFGLGKPRSLLGQWLDQRGLTQKWLVKEAQISEDSATRLASIPDYSPSKRTKLKVLATIRRIDPEIKHDDFWPM